MPSAWTPQTSQLKAANLQNADGTTVYAAGVWSLENSSGTTTLTVSDAGAVTAGPSSSSVSVKHTIHHHSSATTYGNAAVNLNQLNGSTTTCFSFANAGSKIGHWTCSTTYPFGVGDSSGNDIGYCSSAGAWTLGPSTGGVTHRLNGITSLKRADVTSGSGATVLQYQDGSNDICGYVEVNATANTVTYTNSSDARLKTNHRDFDGLSLVSQMKPSKYERICNPNVDEVGLVAQELHDIMPEAVSVGDEDVAVKPWGIDYGRLTPVLVKAIQEQQAIIEDLKTRLAAIEAKP
jgi:hypothetical protein